MAVKVAQRVKTMVTKPEELILLPGMGKQTFCIIKQNQTNSDNH